MMPLGYVELEKINDTAYYSRIISGLPARFDNFFYYSYRIPIYYV